MQKFNLIAQSVLELSHREKGTRRRRQQRRQRLRRHQPGLNYSPRWKVFRRGQKKIFFTISLNITFDLSKCLCNPQCATRPPSNTHIASCPLPSHPMLSILQIESSYNQQQAKNCIIDGFRRQKSRVCLTFFFENWGALKRARKKKKIE